jgi:hypothetical protein
VSHSSLPVGDERLQELANITCAYLLRVDTESEPDDVATSSAFLKLRFKRVRGGDSLVQFLEDTHVRKKKKVASKYGGKGGKCAHCGGAHAASACWDKFPNLRPVRYGGSAPNTPHSGAGYVPSAFVCVLVCFFLCFFLCFVLCAFCVSLPLFSGDLFI